jgi:acetyltransferase-like isoleucine patch superfamily enzyme
VNNFFVHEKALCESNNIGDNTKIWAFCHIMKDVIIGEDCNLCDGAFVESGVKIGNRVTVKNHVSIWNGVVIEDDVFLGPNCVLTNDLFPRSKVYHSEDIKTFIKKGSSIGANATIICGITLGEYCMIAAGSVVTKDVPPYTLVKGNPAKYYYHISKFGEKLEFNNDNIAFDSAGIKYKLQDGKIFILE